MMRAYDKTIVVTGGAGFIGSVTIRLLNDSGFDNIVIVDDLGTDERWKNLVGKRFVDIIPKAEFPVWLKSAHAHVSAIIHLGACSDTTERNAEYLLENNYRYTVQIAASALEHGIRFIYASSAATYGSGDDGFSDDHTQLTHYRPLNMYGYSKHLVDLWMQQQGVLDRVVGLKYFNVYGPNEYHKGRMSSAIVRMVPQVLANGSLSLFASDRPDFADGEQKRDFVYVKDAARMTIAFLKTNANGLYNIASGEAVSWNRLARAVFAALKKKESITYTPMPEDLIGKYQYFTQGDMTKTAKALGEACAVTCFEDAVSEYVNDYLLNQAYF